MIRAAFAGRLTGRTKVTSVPSARSGRCYYSLGNNFTLQMLFFLDVCRLASRSEQLPLAGARRTAAAATAWEPCEEKAGTMGGGRFGKQSCKRATGVQKFNLPMILLRQENSRAQL
nr:protein TMEM155 isoform X3 [Microcebus murinus]